MENFFYTKTSEVKDFHISLKVKHSRNQNSIRKLDRKQESSENENTNMRSTDKEQEYSIGSMIKPADCNYLLEMSFQKLEILLKL